MPIVLRLVEGCAPFVSLGFVFVVRVRYGILDHVCTDTITAAALSLDLFDQPARDISAT
jgi:hypothetical protein